MSWYETLSSRGNSDSSTPNAIIYVYPNGTGSDNEAKNGVLEALENGFGKLIDYGAIDYYEINFVPEYPNLSQSNEDDLLNAWMNYISTSHPTVTDANYGTTFDDYLGCHLLVSGNVGNGKADDPAHDSSFKTGLGAVMGTGKFFKAWWQVVAIHEALHNFIREGLDGVNSMTDGIEVDHPLGKVYENASEVYSSVMITSYEDQYDSTGSCQSPYEVRDYASQELTECTKEAVKVTAQNDW